MTDTEDRLKALLPETGPERQASMTLSGATAVLKEIDSYKKMLLRKNLVPEERRSSQARLIDASERLCNLMALALHQLSGSGNAEFMARFGSALQEIQSKLVEMGTNLMIQKIEQIQSRCDAIVSGREPYPIGLSRRMGQKFSEIRYNLSTLGIDEENDPILAELLTLTREGLEHLARLDEEAGMTNELPERPNRQPPR